ncbi:hypothetical protein P691DRAFT_727270 [Macrolepiota fuliginosa MF-IS2]|uniref:Uncharacterized protein n=1 Tax=Macrolepiota fuliginosa MF-IS2 TaxID=1400762 RepID=A0A9P5XF26_9AGAR|nr:hypothetical protein P691DRAFT_727270 [Macrolepiota fuliginosa MF-IS2]
MFAKIWTSLAILLAVSLEVRGHAAIAPALGLGSTAPVRNDVKRPSTASPCGAGVNVASALGKSTPVQAAADGTFTATITNFNGGKDGSRQVTAQVDAAATGKGANFVAMTVSQNGDAAPATTGSQPIVASIPAGTTCSGGTSGDLCLVSFKTLGGFGNCVAVQQSVLVSPELLEVPLGTRAARALLADLEERGGEIVNDVRRGIASWAWA